MAVYGHIICLGDSLTHGARDGYGRCYPMELSDMLWAKYKQRWICAEEGVNGETSSDVLRRSASVMRNYPDAQEVVLLCGTNDSKDAVNMPVGIFKKNIEGIIRTAAVYEKEVILCTIPDLKGFGAPDYSMESSRRIEGFNEVIEEIYCDNINIKNLVDLRGIDSSLYADGVHFKHSGYIEIARRVLKGIEEKRKWTGCSYESDEEFVCVNDVTLDEAGNVVVNFSHEPKGGW